MRFFPPTYFISCNGPCALKEKWHRKEHIIIIIIIITRLHFSAIFTDNIFTLYAYLPVVALKVPRALTRAEDAEILVTVVTTVLAMVAYQRVRHATHAVGACEVRQK